MRIVAVIELPDPDWYLDNVLVYAQPGRVAPRRPGPAEQWQSWWRKQAGSVAPLVAGQGFVATTAQLPALGTTRQRARTAVRTGRWTATGYGTIAPLDVRDEEHPKLAARRRHALACSAAVLRRPGCVVNGRSAAILRGLPTYEIPGHPELTVRRRGGHGPREAAHLRPGRLHEDEVTSWFGVPVLTLARVLVELGRRDRRDRRDAIMAADAALREHLVTHADLARALERARGWPGARQAREVLALASPRAESALESLVRLVLHDAGFPPPELQVPIRGCRVDMLWPWARLVLEIDGLEKYTGAERRRERRREKRLRGLGFRVERVTWDDVVSDWPATEALLRAALGLPA